MNELNELAASLQLRSARDVALEMKRQDESAGLLASVFILLGAANFLFLGWAYKRINAAIEARDLALEMRYSK